MERKYSLEGIQGLTPQEVIKSRASYGSNSLFQPPENNFLKITKEVIAEPMFILLFIASTIYFAVGEISEGVTLSIAIILVAAISWYQSIKSENALSKLVRLTQPTAKVFRNNQLEEIGTDDIVVGDIINVEEGQLIPADGTLVQTHDLSIDESILTGESIALNKIPQEPFFAGCHLVSGSFYGKVDAIGSQTQLGQLGKSLYEIKKEKSPLQIQINSFVMKMAIWGAFAFLLVWGINYFRTGNIITSLIFGLTIAMSILPEEIPVAFSSFMALGAARMSRIGILTKQPQTVESLGGATVICLDKTGTITTEAMELKALMSKDHHSVTYLGQTNWKSEISAAEFDLLKMATLASEPKPFDPMEKAIHEAYSHVSENANQQLEFIHEYPLSGIPPMMTHVYRDQAGQILVSGKGGIEKILSICNLDQVDQDKIHRITQRLSQQGLRVIGVAAADCRNHDFPEQQEDFPWRYIGLIGLYNPPKDNAAEVIQKFVKAGIAVKVITGDFPETAMAVCDDIGLNTEHGFLTGAEVLKMSDQDLREVIQNVNVYARMHPEAKLRVIKALKQNGEIVAMTGDGVNDSPALKAANIGVSMGKRGSDLAKQASSLVLVNDNLQSMVDGIIQGRKIFSNLKKAISYIVSIHIPIILTVTLPLLLNWKYANIFNPIHIIFLELVMGPTCSIAFENEPAETKLLEKSPRKRLQSFLSANELSLSILQGLIITAGVLGVYYWGSQNYEFNAVRTMVFTTLVMSNIFLTFANRSLEYSIITTIKYQNSILWLMIGITLCILIVTLFVEPVQQLFQFQTIGFAEIGWCTLVAMVSVFWFELYKISPWRK